MGICVPWEKACFGEGRNPRMREKKRKVFWGFRPSSSAAVRTRENKCGEKVKAALFFSRLGLCCMAQGQKREKPGRRKREMSSRPQKKDCVEASGQQIRRENYSPRFEGGGDLLVPVGDGPLPQIGASGNEEPDASGGQREGRKS